MKEKKLLLSFMVAILVLAFTVSTVGADTPIPIEPIDWDRVVPIEEDGYNLQTELSVFVDDIGVDGLPTPITPIFEYTYLKKPIFYFTRDYAANLYSISVWDYYDNDYEVYTYDNAGTCYNYYCTIQSPGKLTPAGLFHTGFYAWAVQSRVGSTWGAWSDWEDFRVMLKKYFDGFDLYPADWWILNGTWTWVESKGRLKGMENTSSWGSILRDGFFYDVDYTVMMKRKISVGDSNAVIIWGDPGPLGSDGGWDDGVYFQYTNNSYWGIWTRQDGVFNWIQGWIYDPTVINEYGWNELRIAGNHPYIDLWLNGNYLGWFYADSLKNYGYTGISMFGVWSDEVLLVDYAKATAIEYTGLAGHDPAMQLGLEPAPEGMYPTSAPLPVLDDPTGTR